jgi:uncharacterized protein YqhQ
MSKITSIGGQALMEGIMMVGPFKTVAAFCDKDGNITEEELSSTPLRKKYPFLGKPFIRGLFSLVDSMRIGIKAMEISADKITQDTGEEEEESKFDKWLNDKFGDKVTGVITGIGTVLGFALAIVLFMMVPTLIFNGLEFLFGKTDLEPLRSLFEGIMKAVIFILYVLAISRIPDIHRVFMYHGAEHKSIFCYEHEEELTVENVKKQSRFHPRCGTSFLVIMIAIGIIVGIFIPFTNPILRTVCKILCLPIIICLGYELLKYCGRHDNLFTKIVSAPGLWVQHITTQEPDNKMIETAIHALKAVIPENGEDIIR